MSTYFGFLILLHACRAAQPVCLPANQAPAHALNQTTLKHWQFYSLLLGSTLVSAWAASGAVAAAGPAAAAAEQSLVLLPVAVCCAAVCCAAVVAVAAACFDHSSAPAAAAGPVVALRR